MNKLIKRLSPPAVWRIPVIILLGVMVGLGFYVLKLSKVGSYLSDNPETCVNCHIMAPQYSTWMHSSHRERAHCNDCHVPHDNVFRKYYFKAMDGFRHASMFTLRMEPQVIFIKEEGKEVVQENCVRCHESVLKDHTLLARTDDIHKFRTERKCWTCHRYTPHGRVNSLSSVPWARVPLPESPVPDWMREKSAEDRDQ